MHGVTKPKQKLDNVSLIRFFNHSDDPNCIGAKSSDDSEGVNIAAKDIWEGEELTCDYREFDADFDHKMNTD